MQISNITANGGWQTVSMPGGGAGMSYGATIQARTATAIQVRAANAPDNVFTIKSGTAMTIQDRFQTNQLEVNATNGTVIEVLLGAVVI